MIIDLSFCNHFIENAKIKEINKEKKKEFPYERLFNFKYVSAFLAFSLAFSFTFFCFHLLGLIRSCLEFFCLARKVTVEGRQNRNDL